MPLSDRDYAQWKGSERRKWWERHGSQVPRVDWSWLKQAPGETDMDSGKREQLVAQWQAETGELLPWLDWLQSKGYIEA